MTGVGLCKRVSSAYEYAYFKGVQLILNLLAPVRSYSTPANNRKNVVPDA